jgi:pimeloyl-ACP methyl ester carboxylesterase
VQVRKILEIMQNCPPRTIENALVAMREREDYVGRLSSIKVPTLVIVGQHDVITSPKIAQTFKDKIPNSKLVQIAGAGHVSTMEKPDEVAEAIGEFVNEYVSN